MPTLLKKPDKLELFTQFALMDQQFSLVVYDSPGLKNELVRLLEKKKKAGVLELQFGKTEVSADSDLLFNKKDGLLVFELNENNLAEAFDAVSQIRHKGIYDAGPVEFRFPDNLKLIFTIDRDFLAEQPAKMREKMLYTFSPVYRP